MSKCASRNGTFDALKICVPNALVRNPLTCKRCNTRLVVTCEPARDEADAIRTFSFQCPACRGMIAEVPLSGRAVERVFLDPRRSSTSKR